MRKPLLKLVEGTKGCPGVSRREAGGQHGRQPLHWPQNFPFLVFHLPPDGREAGGSAGAAVQPMKLVSSVLSISHLYECACTLVWSPWKVDLEVEWGRGFLCCRWGNAQQRGLTECKVRFLKK